jgi:hypothetical protein
MQIQKCLKITIVLREILLQQRNAKGNAFCIGGEVAEVRIKPSSPLLLSLFSFSSIDCAPLTVLCSQSTPTQDEEDMEWQHWRTSATA